MRNYAYVFQSQSSDLMCEELFLQAPQNDEVLVEVSACGAHHSDLHVMKNEVSFPSPAVLGREISGIVRSIGEGVSNVSVGDRVACSFIMPCGTCRHCETGAEDLCETFFQSNRLNGTLFDGTTRMSRLDGAPIAMYSMAGHSQFSVVPSRAVFPVPDHVSLRGVAVAGCSLFAAYGAINKVARLQEGETVAVIAAGGVGLSVIHLARAAGASRVIAIDIEDNKLDLASELGRLML